MISKRDVERFRATLLEQRMQIVAHARRMRAGEVHVDGNDLSDQIENTVSESSLSFTRRMRERDSSPRSRDAARESSSDGECESCKEEVGSERVRARPVANFRIDCKDEPETTSSCGGDSLAGNRQPVTAPELGRCGGADRP